MTAIPARAMVEAMGVVTGLVVPGRAREAQVGQLRAAAGAEAKCLVLRSRGRRKGAAEDLVAQVLEARVGVLVVPSLMTLHPSPARALGMVSMLVSAQVTVQVSTAPWVARADAGTLSAVASYLVAEEERRASRNGRRAIAQVRKAGGVGRPSKPLSVSPEEAKQLVKQFGWRGAGRRTGVSPASLRRALAKAGLLPVIGEWRTP
jgi:hypothetical protein